MRIALDGPSGAGKSTVAKAVAQKLNLLYLDTGAMYRAAALYMLDHGITTQDVKRVCDALLVMDLDVRYEDGVQRVFLGEEDVSQRIRQNAVSAAASAFSALKPVRVYLVKKQQEIAKKYDCILDGRDIGTCVLPDAEFKFYLTADASERARRRALELEQKGEHFDAAVIQKEIEQRDYNDSHREISPLRRAEDAILVDSTHLSADEVVETIIKTIKEG